MTIACVSEVDLGAIIETGSIDIHFQPQVSLKRGGVFGLEALARGRNPETGDPIPPAALFQAARNTRDRLALDRACRAKAFEAFAPLHAQDKGLVLSVNVDASVINETTTGSQVLLRQLKRHGIAANNVVIEIIESRAGDPEALMDFVAYYRKHGFLVALDDVGVGYSNLDRVPLLRPDLLKLDRSLIQDVDKHFHRQEVVKSFVRMAGRVGSLVLAEGVERRGEVLKLLELGIDVFQGFYFGKPHPDGMDHGLADERIPDAAQSFKRLSMERFNAEKLKFSAYDNLIQRLASRLNCPSTASLDQRLSACLEADQHIECLYVLNMRGLQVSQTLCNPDKLRKSKRLLYEPAGIGADHSLKEYYLPLRSGLPKFTTEPYISLASGNRCITISAVFFGEKGEALILCTDISED